jgi:DNA-binding PadR family transcriptional regulator
MRLPELTHLQFFILSSLGLGSKSGATVRRELARQGHRKSGPAFYQLMARLEDAGVISGSYKSHVVDGYRVKERWYGLTGAGARACNATLEFYQRRTPLRVSLGEGA